MMQVEQGFIPALSLRTNAVQSGAGPKGVEAATADGCCLAIESVHALPEFFVRNHTGEVFYIKYNDIYIDIDYT